MMDADDRTTGEPSLVSLLQETADKARTVIEDGFSSLRREMKDELDKGRDAATDLTLGVGMGAVGGILMGFMLAHLVSRTTRLPLWLSYGVVGGLMELGAWEFLSSGTERAAKTAEAVKDQLVETAGAAAAR